MRGPFAAPPILAPLDRANLLETQAYAYYLTARIPDAITAQHEAATIREAQGDTLRLGHNLRRLARFHDFAGNHREAARLVERMYQLLKASPHSPEFALGSGYLAEWRLRQGALAEAVALANQATTIAGEIGDPAVTAHARITLGMVRIAQGKTDGWDILRGGRDLARDIGHEEFVLRALMHLGESALAHRNVADARPYIMEGIAYAQEHDLATKAMLFGSMNLVVMLDGGNWTQVITAADELLRNPATRGRFLLTTQVVRGLARLRSGHAQPGEFASAIEQAARINQPAATSMILSAMAETAWLTGASDMDWRAVGQAIAAGRDAGELASASELLLWMHRSGQPIPHASWAATPYSLEMEGDWLAAARRVPGDGDAPGSRPGALEVPSRP